MDIIAMLFQMVNDIATMEVLPTIKATFTL